MEIKQDEMPEKYNEAFENGVEQFFNGQAYLHKKNLPAFCKQADHFILYYFIRQLSYLP